MISRAELEATRYFVSWKEARERSNARAAPQYLNVWIRQIFDSETHYARTAEGEGMGEGAF